MGLCHYCCAARLCCIVGRVRLAATRFSRPQSSYIAGSRGGLARFALTPAACIYWRRFSKVSRHCAGRHARAKRRPRRPNPECRSFQAAVFECASRLCQQWKGRSLGNDRPTLEARQVVGYRSPEVCGKGFDEAAWGAASGLLSTIVATSINRCLCQNKGISQAKNGEAAKRSRNR